MEKLSMCRICLVEDVRMYVVTNKSLQEVYEKLTDIPYVTEDKRPMLACFFCCTKLKQCCQLQRKCMEAEEVLSQMLYEDYEQKPLRNQGHQEFLGGFIITPIENISIIDDCQIGSDAVKQELAAVGEEEYVFELKLEHMSDEHDPEHLDESHPDVENVPARNSEYDLEDGKLIMEIKIKGEEEQELSEQKQRVRNTESAPAAKKPKLVQQKEDMEKSVLLKHKNNGQEHSKNTENSKKNYCKSINKTEKAISSRTVTKGKPKVTNNTICNNKVAKDRPYKCDICQTSLSQKGHLNNHILTHTGEKPFKCNICQRSFARKGTLNIHIRTHTGEKPYKCDICQRSFTTKGTLNIHIRSHTGEKPYKCDICLSSYARKSILNDHIRMHTGEKPYKCDICPSSYTTRSSLDVHIRTHTGEKPYKCGICPSSYATKSSLHIHIRTHIGEKPYKCDICQSSFIDKTYLNKHIRKHTGKKPFKCDICQRSFARKGTLNIHIRTHTGGNRYKCDICQSSFNYKRNLKTHIRIHTDEKP